MNLSQLKTLVYERRASCTAMALAFMAALGIAPAPPREDEPRAYGDAVDADVLWCMRDTASPMDRL